MTDFRTIFNKVESTLIRVGDQGGRNVGMRQSLEEFKELATKSFTDAEYFRKMVLVVFYSGFRAVTVTSKLPVIDKYFSDYRTVADYGADEVGVMLADSLMIRHEGKIRACIENARAFKVIVGKCGSFGRYVDSFSPKASFDNVMRLRKDLRRRFSYLSKITSYHFLTDIGLPVLKPDRVIMRIFHRLGLIEGEETTEDQLLSAVVQGNRFAQETGEPIRYIDIVFVAYGQVKSGDSIEQGICLKDRPRCNICDVKNDCQYFAKKAGVAN